MPDGGRRACHRIENLRGGINFGIERSVGLAARSIVTAVALIAVRRGVPETAVDVRRDPGPRLLNGADHPGKALFGRQVVGIVRIVGMVVPEVPVYTQSIAEVFGGAFDRIERIVADVFSAHPCVGVIAPLRNVTCRERFAAPLGRKGERTIPPDDGVLPTFGGKAHDRSPGQAERSVFDPAGRSRNRVIEDDRFVRTLHRVGLAAAPAVLCAVVKGSVAVVHQHELHSRSMRGIASLESGNVERFFDTPAFGRNHFTGRRTVDYDAGKLHVGDQPSGRQIGLQVPLQQLAAVGQRDVHPDRIFHRRVIECQLPREDKRFGPGIVAYPDSLVNSVFGQQLGILALRAFVDERPRPVVLPFGSHRTAVQHQFFNPENLAGAENGLHISIGQGVIVAGPAYRSLASGESRQVQQ